MPIPRAVHDLAMRLRRTRDWLADEVGRQPTITEPATQTGASEGDVLEALGALKANEVISLQAPSGGEDEDDERTLADVTGAPDDGCGRIEQRATLDELLDGLAAHEKCVIYLHFADRLTSSEIGSMLGVSRWLSHGG